MGLFSGMSGGKQAGFGAAKPMAPSGGGGGLFGGIGRGLGRVFDPMNVAMIQATLSGDPQASAAIQALMARQRREAEEAERERTERARQMEALMRLGASKDEIAGLGAEGAGTAVRQRNAPTAPTEFERAAALAGVNLNTPEGQAWARRRFENMANPQVGVANPDGTYTLMRPPLSVPQQGGLPRPSTPQEVQALPPGTQFIAPDGTIRTTPGGAGSQAPTPFSPTTPGNIDLNNRPVVRNPDGSVSTVLSMSIGTPQGEVLIPRVVGGRVVSEAEAEAEYRRTGQHLGVFRTPQEATAYARQLHQQQAGQYAPQTGRHSRTAMAESGNRNYQNGRPVRSSAGALYAMQVMPGTAGSPGFGVSPARNNSPAEYNRVGREYIDAMVREFGSEAAGAAAYNFGPGNFRRLLRRHPTNWRQHLPRETQDYLRRQGF